MAQPIAVSKPVRRVAGMDEGLSEFSTQEMYREILSRLGEDPEPRWTGGDTRPRGKIDGLFDQGLHRGPRQACCTARCLTWTTTRW